MLKIDSIVLTIIAIILLIVVFSGDASDSSESSLIILVALTTAMGFWEADRRISALEKTKQDSEDIAPTSE